MDASTWIEHSRTENEIFFFVQSDKSFQFRKAKTRTVQKDLIITSRGQSNCCYPNKVDAALKAQKIILSTSVKTPK